MFQWLRIEPADNNYAGTEDIALAYLYLRPITHMSTEQLHVCQLKEGENNICCFHKKYINEGY